MKYVGGKYRIAQHIESHVLAVRGGRSTYIEPFLGGAATFSRIAPHFDQAWGIDVVPDLVLMWQAVQAGWIPPFDVSEDEYQALRGAESSPLRGFVGFGCSFGGKWFGGYGRQTIAGGKPAVERSLAPGSARSVMRQAVGIRNATIILGDYRTAPVTRDSVVYCDPPYAGTTGYSGTSDFDSREFWQVAETWAESGAVVLVSEYAASSNWLKVWERAMPNYLRGDCQGSAPRRPESLFMRKIGVKL